eukprot:GHVR01040231.1.p5 GENE.GHVR01040231.1~~GHVR01040231.1.p5  ORF type:complete len:116 (-),score=4.92 GHVR01040231.1:167-514(-)
MRNDTDLSTNQDTSNTCPCPDPLSRSLVIFGRIRICERIGTFRRFQLCQRVSSCKRHDVSGDGLRISVRILRRECNGTRNQLRVNQSGARGHVDLSRPSVSLRRVFGELWGAWAQ